MKRRVLVFCATYLPGFKSGGPVRSIAALVRELAGETDFWIMTSDRDHGDGGPYAGIELDAWTRLPSRHEWICYCSARASQQKLASLVRAAAPDMYYINSLFSPRFSMLPLAARRAGLLSMKPVILAPRGELSPGALTLSPRKKRAFLAFAKRSKTYRQLVWHATTEQEAADIHRVFGDVGIRVAGNLTEHQVVENPSRPKLPGSIRIAFLSRISPKKNLLFALDTLAKVRGSVTFDVFGPTSDPAYAARCRTAAAGLPSNITVDFRGPLPHEQVVPRLSSYHLFLLPTLGENFGHVIVEALLAGNVVVTSDQTPWGDSLRTYGAGWALPLGVQAFANAIQRCTDMDQNAFNEASAASFTLGRASVTSERERERCHALFQDP